MRYLSVAVTRNNLKTPNAKLVRLYRNAWLEKPAAIIRLPNGHEGEQSFLADEFEGDWFLQVIDEARPVLGIIRSIRVKEDLKLQYELNDQNTAPEGVPVEYSSSVSVETLPVIRPIVFVEYLPEGRWRIAGASESSEKGAEPVSINVHSNALVYALSMDEWGVLFQGGLAVKVGDLIRPSVFNGYNYRITQAGTLPVNEPNWWRTDVREPQMIGTARAEAVRYYQPLAHGPLPMEFRHADNGS